LTKQNKTNKAKQSKPTEMAAVLAPAAAAAAAHPLVAALLSSLALVSYWRNSARESARERETKVERERLSKPRKQGSNYSSVLNRAPLPLPLLGCLSLARCGCGEITAPLEWGEATKEPSMSLNPEER
jgi:hypothetical protein